MSPFLALAVALQLAPLDLTRTAERMNGPLAPRSIAELRVPTASRLPAPMPQPVRYSAWYYRRLDIHRWGSYAMLPLFAAQYWAGSQLVQETENDWAEDAHPVLALGVASLFASNSVTGIWNLWEGRHDPRDRKRRIAHATLMLLADAGFVATGILADEAEDGAHGGAHRTMALTSMGVATVGWLLMLDALR